MQALSMSLLWDCISDNWWERGKILTSSYKSGGMNEQKKKKKKFPCDYFIFPQEMQQKQKNDSSEEQYR